MQLPSSVRSLVSVLGFHIPPKKIFLYPKYDYTSC